MTSPPPVENANPTAENVLRVADERNFRPPNLDEFIGQPQVKSTLRLMLDSAKKRASILEHLVFYGGPGLGKTTLAAIIATEQGARLHEVSAPALVKPGDLAALLVMLQRGDVLFLDEVHALRRELAEMLYSGMEDFKISIKTGEDASSKMITMGINKFSLVAATTDYGLLPEPMRARFGHSFLLQPYSVDDLGQIVFRAANSLEYLTDDDALHGIAVRSRGTPRVALRLFRRCVDYAVSEGTDIIDGALVENTMPLLGLDSLGLEDADRKYLLTLATTYKGGPAGPRAIAANCGLDLPTVEHVVEPGLLIAGLIARTPRGRRITRKGYDHLKSFTPALPNVNWTRVERADSDLPAEVSAAHQ